MNLSKKTAIIIFSLLFPSNIVTFLLVSKLQDVGFSSTPLIFYIELILASLLVSLLLSLLLWKVFSYYVTHPIQEINKIIKIINSGNLGVKVAYGGKNELGELADNINGVIVNVTRNVQSMANSLRGEKEKENELAANLAKLQQAQAKDEALLDNLGEGVVAIDEKGKIFLFNKTATALTGFMEVEALGKSYTDILHFGFEKVTDMGQVPDFIDGVLTRKPMKELSHIEVITKYQIRVPITQSTTMITDQAGKNLGVIVVLRDVTRERQLDKLKNEFVSIASHELRTPMTAIKGLISMIFEGDYGEVKAEMKEPLSDIASSTQRLIELVNDMLDISRLEGGRIKYSLSSFQVSDVIKQTLQLMHPVALQKGIELRFSESEGTEVVQADPGKIKQILSNLVGNALKFTDKGFIEIKCVPHDDLVIVSVRDSGIGIKPDDQKKLFSKFQQVTTSQMGRPVGTGLGLYISREFAKKMGGDLWIANSQEGVGSIFSLSIPIVGSGIALAAQRSIMQTE